MRRFWLAEICKNFSTVRYRCRTAAATAYCQALETGCPTRLVTLLSWTNQSLEIPLIAANYEDEYDYCITQYVVPGTCFLYLIPGSKDWHYFGGADSNTSKQSAADMVCTKAFLSFGVFDSFDPSRPLQT